MEKIIGIAAVLFLAAVIYYLVDAKAPPSPVKTISLWFIIFVVIVVLVYAAWPYISRL